MQHHQHATRASTAVAAPPPPHMLVAGQHMTAKYATTATNTVPAQQQQQQQHHIASVAVATTPGDASYSSQQQQQHMRDVRLQHQTVYPIPPQTLRGAAPMHKVLQQQQQQQHLNNNNNNKTRNNNINNNKSNNNHHHQQPQPMHTAVLQQHPQHTGSNKVRNINSNGHHHHHHQQPPPPATSAHHYPQHLAYATHINATPSEHMGVATQQQQQTQPPAGAPPPPLPEHQRNGPTATAAYHQQQAATQHHTIPMHGTQQKVPHLAPHHYYNSNGHGGGGTYTIYTTQPPPHVPTLPKQILQNPNRVLKPRQQQQQVSSATATPTTLTPTHRAQSNAPAGGATAAQSTTVTTSNTNEPHEEHQQQPETQQHSNGNVIAPSSDNKENVLNLEQIQTDLKKRGEQQHNNEQASNCSSNGSTQHKSNKNNNNQSNILSNEDLSAQKNSKEKTPMCLVNELARFNKIIHQYRLTSEKGPAHCKRFTVTLKLGEEEYSAEGFKIKKAQHLAAAEAIEKTKYKHPVPKTRRNEDSSQPRAHITPTVELNALAMKLGQQTYYLFDPRQMAEGEQLDPAHGMPQQPSPPPTLRGHVGNGAAYQQIQAANGMPMPVPPLPPHPHHARYMHAGHPHAPHGPVHARGMYPPKYPQRYPVINGMIVTGPPVPAERYYTLPPHRPTKITLIVGKQKFVGLGRTLQQAKHDAAARALQVLKTQSAEQQHQQSQEALDTSGSQDGDNKSPISKVHEIGIRRNMSVHFKVLREEGPAHMKNFVTACVVGSIITEGEGNGKKISKKRSAEKMLEELRKLPPLTPTKSPLKRIKVKTPGKMSSASEGTKGGGGGGRGKRAISSALKEKQLEEDNANDEDNPITKLIQIQQGRKEKEPTFELISKNASEHSRRREFIIEVTAQGRVARGTGPNKKVAKRNAAQNLLIAMGLLEAPMETTKQNAAATTVPPVSAAAAASVNIINPTNTTNQMTATSNDPITANTATAIPNGAETAPVTTTKAIENLEVPLITTPAGQVPGILILRQNKKHASKRKEAVLSVSKETEELNEAAPKHHDAPATTVAPDTTTATSTTHSANAAADSSTQPIKPTSSNGTIESTSSITTLPASTAAPAVTAAVSSNVSSTSNSSSNTTANGKASSVTASSTSTSTATTTTTSTTSSTTKSSGGVHMKDQLLYLSKLLGFEVNFSDYPKGNHSEFLTIVTLSSDPPQICHGVGANSEESQNDAAKNALKILSELGLNCGK